MGSDTYKNLGGTSDNINIQYTVYRGGARILVRGENIGKKLFFMNFFQVLYCNDLAKISVRWGHSALIYSSKTFEKF